MIFNILICDDEETICTGIAQIASEVNGINVFVAHSGTEALKIASQNTIDGMILDIRMPVMDGLETLRKLREELHSTATVVILSGHEQFKYAQQALRYGCSDYLLKPLAPNMVRELLAKMIGRITKRQQAQNEIRLLHEQVSTIRPIIRERVFYDLLNNSINKERLASFGAFIGIDFQLPFSQVVIIQAADQLSMGNEEDYQFRLYAIGERIKKAIAGFENSHMFNLSTGMFALLISSWGANHEGLLDALEDMVPQCYEEYDIVINVGVGNIVDSVTNIRLSYNQALKALSFFSKGQYSGIVHYCDLLQNGTRLSKYINVDEVVSQINLNNMAKAISIIENAFSIMIEDRFDFAMDSAMLLCSTIVSAALTCIENMDGTIENFVNAIEHNPLSGISSQHTLQGLFAYTVEVMKKVALHLEQCMEKKNKRIIEKGKQLIYASYNQNIGVGWLAEQLCLSKNYFGQLFKAESGITVNEYINYVRIDKAKELLLKTNKRIYEIAFDVGFKDNFYFSSVFKKIVGLSPKDYQSLR